MQDDEARFAVTFTSSSWEHYSAAGWIALTAWMVLLGVALWMAFTRMRRRPGAPERALLAMVFVSVGLHIQFGPDLMLYSPHWAPPLVALVGVLCSRGPRWTAAVEVLFLAALLACNASFHRLVIRYLA